MTLGTLSCHFFKITFYKSVFKFPEKGNDIFLNNNILGNMLIIFLQYIYYSINNKGVVFGCLAHLLNDPSFLGLRESV